MRRLHRSRCQHHPQALGRPTSQRRRFLLVWASERGASGSISAARGTPPRPQAFGISLEWFRYFLTQNPQFDWTTITHDAYERLFDQSVEQFGAVIGTDNPDLTEFRIEGARPSCGTDGPIR